MRPCITRVAIVTIFAIFAAAALAAPAQASPAPSPAAPPAAPPAADRPHPVLLAARASAAPQVIVRRGDSLSLIAKRACPKRPRFWMAVWWANRKRVDNPNEIYPGQRLVVPSCSPVRRAHAAAALAAIPAPPPPPPAAAAPASPPAGAAAPAPAPRRHHHSRAPPAQAASYSGSGMEACIISRESGGNPRAVNPTSGAGGLYQFLPSTWAALGHSGQPQNASVAEQRQAFEQEVAASGYSAWTPYDGC